MPVERLTKVSASAGSGKTYWLTSEFFSLLGFKSPDEWKGISACVQPGKSGALNRILAITFTNAAASEMRDRIITRLKKAALELPSETDESLPDAKLAEQWLENILKNFGSLNIRTIDSLLHLIVRSSTLELGLNPDFETAFDFTEIFDPWLDEIFEKAREDTNLRKELYEVFNILIETGGLEGFTSKGKIRKKIWDVFDRLLLGDFDQLITTSELQQLYASSQQAKSELQKKSAALLEISATAGAKLHSIAQNKIQQLADGIIEKKMTAYASKRNAAEICGRNSPCPQELEDAFTQWSTATLEYYDKIAPKQAAIKKALQLLLLINFARKLKDRYDSEKSNTSNVPSLLIPVYAANILQDGAGVSEAICKLGTHLTHFLIDEFQDTSKAQWQAIRSLVIEALATGGTLGAVGDSKQSIYSWRGGDYKIFSRLLDDGELTNLAELAPAKILFQNRRSLAAIVQHNNKLFGVLKDPAKAFGALRIITPKVVQDNYLKAQGDKLAEIYQDVEQEIAAEKSKGGIVQCLEITGENQPLIWENSVTACGDLVVSNLLQKHRKSDILILCRSNNDCMTIAKELVRRKVAVITENSLLIGDHPLIVQTLAFLNFLNNPENDIAFWTLVTGSIINQHPEWEAPAQEDLETWLLEISEKPVLRQFASNFPQIWQKFFAPFLSKTDYQSAYDAVRDWYNYLDVENRFKDDLTFLRRFLEILYNAEKNTAASVGDFLEYWQKSGYQEKAPMPENADAVQIMTVHKAKGLQKKVVIVPKTHHSLKLSTTITLQQIDGQIIPMPLSSTKDPHKKAEAYEQLAFEYINILYVAFTRAQEELYYFINRKLKDDGQAAEPDLIEYLQSEADLHPAVITLSELPKSEPNSQSEKSACVSVKPINQNLLSLSGMAKLKVYRAHPENEELTPIERGNFMHRCLERLIFANSPEKAAEIAFNSILRQINYPIPEEERRDLLDNLKWFANLPFAKNWLENGWREQNLMTGTGDLLRPDLLIRNDNDILVIDYKTGEPEETHIRQVQTYLRVLGDTGSFAGKIQGLLVYLDKRKFLRVLPTRHFTLSNSPDLSVDTPNE